MKGKTRIWIGMVLLFISGVAVGFVGSGLVLRKQVREFVERGPAHMNARIVNRALRDMDLTDEQRSEIDRIVEETSPEMRRFTIEFGDSIESMATAQFESIKAVLDEEQGRILDRRIEEIRERMKRRMGRPGHRPGRGDHRREDRPGGG
jgi:hypothetical protein